MILKPTREQRDLADSVRAFLAKHCSSEAVRDMVETDRGYDEDLWTRVCQELGIPSLAVSEAGGGAGYGIGELALAAQECGAALLPGPMLASGVLSALVLDAIGDTTVLPDVVAGVKLCALVNDTGVHAADGVLDGTASQVLGADVADMFVVIAGDAVYGVPSSGAGVSRSDLVSLDVTRRQSSVTFDRVAAIRLGGHDGVAAALDRARVVIAADSLGVMQRSVSMAVEYAKEREQFGRKIGSFQAVKHGIADIYTSYELAESAVRYAAWAADHAPEELAVAVAVCQAFVLPEAFNAAFQMIQYHGGIGYTWEHDAHLYYKRAKVNETLLGSAEDGLSVVAAALLDN